MRTLFVVLALAWATLAALPAIASEAPIDVVFDLDWTLIYATRPEVAGFERENVIVADGQLYRFSDHAVDVLLKLHETPPFRISFFSGGEPTRNRAVVDELYRRINARAPPGKRFQPYRVGDKELLTPTGAPETARFPERFKKDLRKLIADVDLSRALLIDDIEHFVAAGQEGNVLWLQDTFDDVPIFGRPGETAKLKIEPRSRTAWAVERNKLAWAIGVATEAERLARETPSVSFVEHARRLTHDRGGALIRRTAPSQLELAKTGLRAMGLPERPLERIPQDELSRCGRRLTRR
ncbi:MAG: hypothetical protein HY075_03730 [Deltaproteobacteria bacterium]|nr:hypothetical protein [Deltaproteobacteria bacterium]